MRFITRAGSCVTVGWTLLLAPVQADAVPANGNYLTGLGAGSFQLISDGTSNTIQLTETTRLAVCFDQVGFANPSPITDGTSNTLMFGESAFLTVRVGSVLPRQPIGGIADGTSNTIFLGESLDSLCFGGDTQVIDPTAGVGDGTSNTILLGEASRFDVCFRIVRLGGIADGTSNTILFSEVTTNPVCFEDVSVAVELPATAPEPSVLASLGIGLAALWGLRLRRFTSASRRPAALAALG